jgi:MFS family permease
VNDPTSRLSIECFKLSGVSSATTAVPSVAGPRRAPVFVAVLAAAGITVSLQQTLVVPLVPQFPRLLGAPAADTAWVVTSTLLTAAVATPVVGRLADMVGKRRMMVFCLVMLISGSVVAALSTSLVPLIVGRALQGLSTGLIPLGISLMRDELPPERLGSATALMSASLGVGGSRWPRSSPRRPTGTCCSGRPAVSVSSC